MKNKKTLIKDKKNTSILLFTLDGNVAIRKKQL